MLKFKTLFRKSHGSSGSGSSTKNKNIPKCSNFESAVTISAASCDKEFEKPAVTNVHPAAAASAASLLNFNPSDICVESGVESTPKIRMYNESANLTVAANADINVENIKKELESVMNEKCNLEFTLQELVRSHGELETLRKEIETLKVCITVQLIFGINFCTMLVKVVSVAWKYWKDDLCNLIYL